LHNHACTWKTSKNRQAYVTIRHSPRPSTRRNPARKRQNLRFTRLSPQRHARNTWYGTGKGYLPPRYAPPVTRRGGINSGTDKLRASSPVPITILTRPLLRHLPHSRALPTNLQQRERVLPFSPGCSREPVLPRPGAPGRYRAYSDRVLPIFLSYNERVLPLVAGCSRCTKPSPSGAPDGESATRDSRLLRLRPPHRQRVG